MSNKPLPSKAILYSFRRCPYAIRARMALAYSQIQVELREVKLADKPESLKNYSSKNTVPILILNTDNNNEQLIDESIDILHWSLSINDPDGWIPEDERQREQGFKLVQNNDFKFKPHLDKYKYFDRFPEQSQVYYRAQAEAFIAELETTLTSNKFLLGHKLSFADIAIFPFIRQFSNVDANWFHAASYTNTLAWLEALLKSELFAQVMDKYPVWQPGDKPVLFPLYTTNTENIRSAEIEDS